MLDFTFEVQSRILHAYSGKQQQKKESTAHLRYTCVNMPQDIG